MTRLLLSLGVCLAACGGGAASKPPTGGAGEGTGTVAPDPVQLTVDLAGGATDAGDYQQHLGPNASASTAWTDEGADLDGVTCDAAVEGLGWCLDDATLYACASGTWRSTSCAELFEDGACGVVLGSPEDAPGVVDCGHRGEMLADPMESELGG